jgi:glutamyl-tRNA synthetase
MPNKIITRFAPSPTGFLHIGGVRTALFAYLFAKHHDGKFLLRIEDTDNKRLVEESVKSIQEGLQWLGLEHDDPVSFQSDNFENHLRFAAKLLDSKDAYFCYCTQEDLEKQRGDQAGFKYSGKCKKDSRNLIDRNHSHDENYFFQKLKEIYGENSSEESHKPVLRFDSSKFEKIEFDDLISGHAIYQKDNLDDFILLKNTGIPTFMFAVVVDDLCSGITHIIRGNDHHTNTAKHLMIYDALQATRPIYAHLPLIMSEDGTKMSKRKNAVDIMGYKNQGFLPEAILNYLLLLGFSPEGGKEFLNLQEMIEEFGIKKVHNSPARFDSQKLKKINQHYLIKSASENDELQKILDRENFYILAQEEYESYKFSTKTKKWIFESIPEIVKRIELLSEVLKVSTFYLENWMDFFTEDIIQFIEEKISNSVLNLQLLLEIKSEFESIKSNFRKEEIDSVISRIAAKFGVKKGEIMKIFRAIFTGVFNSYSISFILERLGFDESISRLEFFEKKFSIC